MIEFTINYLAVVVSAIASMAIGFVWYSPNLFGKMWMEFSGTSSQMQEERGKDKQHLMRSTILGFIAALVMAFVLTHAGQAFGATSASDAFQLAFWVWLGFVATVQVGIVLWEQKPWKLYVLNTTYQLVALIVMSLIVVLWV